MYRMLFFCKSYNIHILFLPLFLYCSETSKTCMFMFVVAKVPHHFFYFFFGEREVCRNGNLCGTCFLDTPI